MHGSLLSPVHPCKKILTVCECSPRSKRHTLLMPQTAAPTLSTLAKDTISSVEDLLAHAPYPLSPRKKARLDALVSDLKEYSDTVDLSFPDPELAGIFVRYLVTSITKILTEIELSSLPSALAVKSARLHHRLSQDALALAAGLSRRQLIAVEAGRVVPTSLLLTHIIDAAAIATPNPAPHPTPQ